MAEFQRQLGIRYQLVPESEEVSPAGKAPDPLWLFEDRDRAWTASLTRGSIGLEAETYHDFDDFAAELERILSDAAAIFEPQTEVRLGVRYVNRIEDERLSKRGIGFFVNQSLASPVGSELGSELDHSLCELRFRERNTWLTLRHGLIDPDVYLLDFDNFIEEEVDFSPPGIVHRVGEFHGLIERLFVWSLSPRYLKELKGGGR